MLHLGSQAYPVLQRWLPLRHPHQLQTSSSRGKIAETSAVTDTATKADNQAVAIRAASVLTTSLRSVQAMLPHHRQVLLSTRAEADAIDCHAMIGLVMDPVVNQEAPNVNKHAQMMAIPTAPTHLAHSMDRLKAHIRTIRGRVALIAWRHQDRKQTSEALNHPDVTNNSHAQTIEERLVAGICHEMEKVGRKAGREGTKSLNNKALILSDVVVGEQSGHSGTVSSAR